MAKDKTNKFELFELAPKDAKRPFRVWNTAAKKHLIGRNYKTGERAQDSALVLTYKQEVGDWLDVYDARTGLVKVQFGKLEEGISAPKKILKGR